MADSQIVKRVKRLGVSVAIVGAFLGFLLWCADIYMHKIEYGAVVLMVGLPAILGWVIWMIGWFLQPSPNRP